MMMKPGFLIHYKGKLRPRFCPVTGDKIINNLHWMDRIPVNKHENSILMFVEPLDYSKETAAMTLVGTVASAMVQAARQEFEKTGKIPGGIFLTGAGKKIWISHYDLSKISETD